MLDLFHSQRHHSIVFQVLLNMLLEKDTQLNKRLLSDERMSVLLLSVSQESPLSQDSHYHILALLKVIFSLCMQVEECYT